MLIAALLLFACNDEKADILMYVPVEEITIEEELSLCIGETHQFVAELSPEDVTNPKVYWSIKDDLPVGCVTIDANGLLSANQVGTATVVATPTGKNFSAECAVTVEYAPIPASAIEFAVDIPTEVAVGKKAQFDYVITPDNADDYTISWALEDLSSAGCATIDEVSGEVSGVAIGSATVRVTATNSDNTSFSATTPINIVEGTMCQEITIPSSATVTEGFTTKLAVTSFMPDGVTDKTVTWHVKSGSDYIDIDADSGEVTAKAIGEAVVYAQANDGSEVVSNDCAISVIAVVNCIANGDFEAETNFESWTKAASATALEFTYTVSGAKTVRFSTPAQWVGFVRQKVTVEAGATYKMGLTGRVQSAAGASGEQGEMTGKMIKMQIGSSADFSDLTSTFTMLEGSSVAEISSNADTKVEVEITIPEDFGTEATINICKTGGWAYVDDAFLIKIDE